MFRGDSNQIVLCACRKSEKNQLNGKVIKQDKLHVTKKVTCEVQIKLCPYLSPTDPVADDHALATVINCF